MRPVERSNRFGLAIRIATFAAVALSACTEPKKDVTPASVTALSATTFSGVVGTQLASPIQVVVKNAGGEPLEMIPVTFAVTSGGGSVGSATVTTDTAGRASTTWTLGTTAGTQTVTATVSTTGTTAVAPLTFTATAAAGPATTMTKVAGTDALTATAGSTVATPPAVKVTDQYGNPIANVLVTFAVASGGGSVTGASVNTGADGVARLGSWRLGSVVGANSVTASAASLPTLTFTATGVAGAVARVEITNTAPTLTTGQTFKLTARALDANNNVISGATIGWSSANANVATVDATGTVTAVGAGTALITASSGGVSATQTISVIGHPSGVVIGTVTGRAGGIAVVGSTALIAHPFAHELAVVDLATATTISATDMVDPAVDVAAPRSGTGPVAVATNGGVPLLWFVNASTKLRTDSIELPAPVVKIAMTSNGSRVLVDMSSFQLAIIDVASRSTVTTVPLGGTVTAMRMGPGDSLVYIGTKLGLILEVNTTTGAIRRRFQPSSTVTDLNPSPDGKTLFVADGTMSVTMVPLFSGGLSGTVDYDLNVTAVTLTPDASELWAAGTGLVVAAPFRSGQFVTTDANKRYTLSGATLPTRILFTQFGNFAVVQDDGSNQVFILR